VKRYVILAEGAFDDRTATVECACHGSVFDAATGDVVTGPATSPLPAVPVEVRDGAVYLAGGG